MGKTKSAAVNQAKQTSDNEAPEVQGTLGDMVPDQDNTLEQLTAQWVTAKAGVDKATEKLKSAKAALRDAMVERELNVYHCRTLDKKVVAKDELTVRVVRDSPDGSEG